MRVRRRRASPLGSLAALPLLAAACGEPAAPRDSGVDVIPPLDHLTGGGGGAGDSPVLINELMADNESTVMDELLQFDDWVELVSVAGQTLDLGGWMLTDDAGGEDGWSFAPGTLLDPGEHLLVWLDGEPDQGSLHASFSLDDAGEVLELLAPDGEGGYAVADSVTFGAQEADVVLGRFPDAGAEWAASIWSTPANANPAWPGAETDPSSALFPADDVIAVELWLPQESRDALAADPYTEVPGSLAFQGAWISPVGIRLKGQIGSYRTLDQKAAFRISLDTYLPGQRLRGLEHLTLNNMVQDPSLVHERLAYQLMRSGDVPAPRVAYAAVYLNGAYRGLYLNVETNDDQFLQRWFDDPDGNLYEGAYGADVTLAGMWSLEHDEQGSADVSDRSDLLALAELLDREPSENLTSQFEALVDVDTTARMLACEVLTGHWDGYFYAINNYRIYHEPSTGRFTLLPWGIDQTYGWTGGIHDATGALAWWMLEVPSLRSRYDAALEEMALRFLDQDVDAEAWSAYALAADWYDADPYRENDLGAAQSAIQAAVDFAAWWPDDVLDQLASRGAP